MLTEFRKSISSILYERMTSPFFGTLIISWIIWNWKIVYLTFFISEDVIDINKIDYIVANYSNVHLLVTFPLLSTALLITVIPFVSNGAYWLSLKFHKWKYDKKNEIDKSKLITLEQSIQIRNEISDQEEKFNKLLDRKENDIKVLEGQIQELTTKSQELRDQNAQLRILKATYGTKEKFFDVTKQLTDLVKDNRLEITASNDIAGDPHKNETKDLEIIYLFNERVQTKTVKEGSRIVIED